MDEWQALMVDFDTSTWATGCPADVCTRVCSVEGANNVTANSTANVTVTTTFHCYNISIIMAPSRVLANDKAVANGCFGSHAMVGRCRSTPGFCS